MQIETDIIPIEVEVKPDNVQGQMYVVLLQTLTKI